jgi:hypothetical protein
VKKKLESRRLKILLISNNGDEDMNIQYLPEEAVDRHIDRAVKWHKGSDTRLKFACIAASPIVGTYSDGTAKIAKESRRSVSAVENWAHAHWLYKAYRSNGHRKASRFLWREMPASFWWLAYDIHTAGYDAMHYLQKAYEHKSSSRDMMADFKADRDAGQAPLIFHRAKIALRGLANELIEKHWKSLNKDQRQVLVSVTEMFRAESGAE